MKILYIKRRTQYEKRYSIKMGELITKVTSIKKYLFGLPVKTLHLNKETYYKETKHPKDGMLFV
ncbi:hypothetical protein JJL45_08455 [Tamlana sp. s12]|uniref:hypothetical protein n=1 Tax=Tamlana sp. s12 TaxID=1630406 RepID=UPI0007FD8F98|nr:hypothetical protein [Tamlana sp. s12]OBQ55352.1 hypothetical protein VQ01_07690 [Tamlana sp. s12]QQY80970.1 hypothetical protein JJL45_08455 [Tamlana sp. s12]